jgi:hypothetical protein
LFSIVDVSLLFLLVLLLWMFSLLFLVDAMDSLLVLYCGCFLAIPACSPVVDVFLAALFSPVRFSRASLCLGGSLPPS